MGLNLLKNKAMDIFKKYKYALIIVLIGLVLITIPEKQTLKEETPSEAQLVAEEVSLEEALSNILCKIKGAGKVEVMLTVLEGEEVLYQEDKNLTGGDETDTKRTDTVIVSDTNRTEAGLVRQVNPPVYRGAIIVCQGADDPIVKLAVTEAVSRITGIGANCISVLKMN